jgi:hypothetical protein
LDSYLLQRTFGFWVFRRGEKVLLGGWMLVCGGDDGGVADGGVEILA